MSPSEIAARPSPLSDPSPFRLPSPTPASLRGLPRSSSARILDLLSTNDGQSSLVSDRHGGAARIHWQFSPSRARVPTDTPQVFETPRGKSSPALNDNHVSARGRDVEEVRRDLGISLGQLMGDLFADADARPDMRPGRSAAMLRGRHDAAWDRISSSIELWTLESLVGALQKFGEVAKPQDATLVAMPSREAPVHYAWEDLDLVELDELAPVASGQPTAQAEGWLFDMPDIRPPRERIETKRDAVEELAWHYRHRLRRLLAGIPEIWGAWFFGMHITTGNSGPDLVRVEKSEHPLRLEVKAASQAIVLDLDQIERYARTPDTFFLLFFHGAQQPLSRLEELFAPAAEDGGAEDVYAHAMRSIADAMHEDSSLYLLPASLMRPLYDSLSTFESQGDRQRGISKKLSRSACEAFLSGMEDSSVRRVALDDTGNSLAVVGGSSTERRFFATGTWSREPVAVRPKKPRRNIYGLPKMEVPKAPDTGMDDLFGRRPKRRKLLSTEKLKTPDDDCPF